MNYPSIGKLLIVTVIFLYFPACTSCSSDVLVPIPECEPYPEVCDGLDNDCDGVVDRMQERCETACGLGWSVCNYGSWGECSAKKPSEEICDSYDNDCDGKIDESDDMPIEICYTGDPWTLASGECRPGIRRCDYGAWVCAYQVLPQPEKCDSLDNDCDGQIDEGLQSTTNLVDIMFIIDNSCSMSDKFEALKLAIENFNASYSGDLSFRWGLVTAPDSEATVYLSHVRLAQDLTDAQTFMTALNMQNGQTGSPSEPTVDALMDICTNRLSIHWTPGARRAIVLLTDEDPQSYNYVPIKTALDAKYACQGVPVHQVFCFVSMMPLHPDWRDLCTSGANRMYNIGGNVRAGFEDTIARLSCGQ